MPQIEEKPSATNTVAGNSNDDAYKNLHLVSNEILKGLNQIDGKLKYAIPAKFDAINPSTRAMSYRDYLARIVTHYECSTTVLIIGIIYMARYVLVTGQQITHYNGHRLLATTIMVAAKFWDEAFYNNAFYAKTAGVPPAEMNTLEIELLYTLKFGLWVDLKNIRPEMITDIFNKIICPGKQHKRKHAFDDTNIPRFFKNAANNDPFRSPINLPLTPKHRKEDEPTRAPLAFK